MPNDRPYRRSFFAIGLVAALFLVGAASPAAARTGLSTAPVRVAQLDGFAAPGTPDQYNKVGIIETGPKAAKNVLVLVPGTSASAAYFEPIARDIVWYHPMRLTIDAGAVADGNANPAQQVLDVHATHGADLPKRLRIYAFGAALGGTAVLDEARTLAEQSGIPSGQLVLVDRHDTYSHNDPSAASPANAFLQNLTPFLHEIGG